MPNKNTIIAPPKLFAPSSFTRRKTMTRKYKPALAGLTAVTLGMSGLLMAAPANADPGYSAAEAQYLSGTLLDLSLQDLAEIQGERAEVPFDATATQTQSGNLNLNVVGDTITVQLPGGIQVPIDIADAGVVGQYAQATPQGNSTAVTGAVTSDGVVDVDPDPANPPGPLTLDLSDLLGQDITSQIANANLTVGATTASAQQNGNGAPTGDYNIAGLQLVLTSPTVAALSGDISDSATPLEDTVNGVVGPNGSVVTSLTGLLNTTDAVTSDVSLDLDLNPVVDNVLAQNQILGADGPVTVDLSTGNVTVDVAALLAANGLDLNDLDPNTEIMNTQLVGLVTAEVDSLVNGLLDTVNDAVTTALDAAVLNLNVTVGDPANPLLNVAVNGPLSDIADGTLVGNVTLGDTDVDPALINTTLQTVVQGVLNTRLNTAAVDTALDGLYPAVDSVLTDVVSLTANNQATTDGVFTETGLRLSLLNVNGTDGQALTLDLARASVGPNALVVDPANPDTTIVSFTPQEGPEAGGTEVTIRGGSFTGATGVNFGNTPGTNFTVVSDTEITVDSPAGTGSVPLTVVGTPYGDATSTDNFTYLPGSISGFTPQQGPEAGGTVVVITGEGFTGATGVDFGATPAANFTVNSDTQITATTAPGTGSVPVTVATTAGDVTSTDEFTFIPASTDGSIVSFDPVQGPEAGGTVVTITGDGFTGATEVAFGDIPADSFVVDSDTQITATTAPGTGTVPVSVTTPAGTIISTDNFTFIPAGNTPSINGILPNQGPEDGGTVTTISGSGFTGATGVNFGDAPATDVVIVSDTEITATSPAGTGSVPITVVKPGGNITSNGVDFTYVADNTTPAGPVIDSFDPTSGPSTGGTTVTIIGSGFDGTTGVNFGNTPGTDVNVVSDTEITVTAPAGTGSVPITVLNPNGNVTSTDNYTYTGVADNGGTDPDGGATPVDVPNNNGGTGNNGGDGNTGGTDGNLPTITTNNGAGGTNGFENCDAAAAAGVSNIKADDPNYAPKLDRDGDGVACESDGSDGSGNKASNLAYTGTDVLPLGLLAAAMLVVGSVVFIARRRA